MELEGGRRFQNYRNVILTKYFKVSDKKAIQVEIQRSASDSSIKKKSTRRVERKHLKEIECLLKDAIMHQIENEDKKSKKNLTECKILTGEIVRLGYTFKKKPENQFLLLSEESDEDDFYAHSLKICSEKVVVFYYPLDQEDSLGSSTAMSQMVRALNDGNLSQSQTGTVSISSYFQKKGTSSTLKNKTNCSSGKAKTTTDMDDKCEEIEEAGNQPESSSNRDKEKHLALKNMIKCSAPALSRRTKHRKVMTTNSRPPDIYHFEGSNDSTDYRKTYKSSLLKDNDFHEGGLSPTSRLSMDDGDLHPCQNKGSPSKILADRPPRDCARMDLDFSSSHSSSEDCEMNDRMGCTLSVKSKEVFASCVASVDSDNSSCAVDAGFFKQNVCNSSTRETSFSESVTRLGSDSDLPDFSFLKMKTRASCLNQVEEKDYEESQKSQYQCDVRIQGSETGPVLVSSDEVTRPQKRPFSTMSASDEDSSHKDEKRSKLKRPRVKRILPKFSEDNLEANEFQTSTEKISSKDTQVNDFCPLPVLSSSRNRKNEKGEKTLSKEIQVNDLDPLPVLCSSRNRKNEKGDQGLETDSMDDHSVCRKNELFKRPQSKSVGKNKEPRVFSFKKASSSNKVKRQSILNFLSLSEQEESSEDTASVEEGFRDSDSLESIIIDGLDDLKEPKFKDYESEAIETEINCLSKVDELNEQHLHYLLMKHKVYLQDIFSGKVSSERHDVYKKGGKARKDLNHHVHLGLFTEEQLDVVMETLMSIFCKKHHKYLEYIMKVLLPEALIKIYMNFHKMSHKEAEEDMLEAVRTPGGIHI